MLPEPMADAVQAFLAHHFSYTFALEALEAACYDSIAAPFTVKQVATVHSSALLNEDEF